MHEQADPSDGKHGGVKVQGLSRTLFERLQGKFGSKASAMLTMQYRMNTAIMQWPSHGLYQDLLTAHISVATHTLQGLQVRAVTAHAQHHSHFCQQNMT